MAVGGEAPWALGVMWTLTAIAATFVALRLYTRVVVIDSFGTDDAVYSVAFVCCMAFSFAEALWRLVLANWLSFPRSSSLYLQSSCRLPRISGSVKT